MNYAATNFTATNNANYVITFAGVANGCRKVNARTALREAKAKIDHPNKWCRGKHQAGGRLDASEALSDVLWSWDDRDEHPATRVLREVTPARYERLSDFNDAHSHRELMALFDRAIRRTYR